MEQENKKLYELRRFKVALMGPIFIAALVSVCIGINSNLQWSGGYEGFNNLFIFFKVPMYIASLSFPLVALVAATHRSEQTSKQIDLALRQSEAAIRPLLEFEMTSSESMLALELHNKGQAVAILKDGLDIYYKLEKVTVKDLKVITANLLKEVSEKTDSVVIHGNEFASSDIYIQKDICSDLLRFELTESMVSKNPRLIERIWKENIGLYIGLDISYQSLSGKSYKLKKGKVPN